MIRHGFTEPERHLARALIDAARRALLHRNTICANCQHAYTPKNNMQIYCSTSCRALAWRRTEKGRAVTQTNNRRKRQVAA